LPTPFITPASLKAVIASDAQGRDEMSENEGVDCVLFGADVLLLEVEVFVSFLVVAAGVPTFFVLVDTVPLAFEEPLPLDNFAEDELELEPELEPLVERLVVVSVTVAVSVVASVDISSS
jgi:hypothetical protein